MPVFSAPGKALVAGGYLVLFPEFSSLSIALSSRMYAAATRSESALTIASPQFVSTWHFPSGAGTHRNPFLEACYETVVAYLSHDVTGAIEIFSDPGFHSQQGAEPNAFHSRFSSHGIQITEVPKTGLGSSAALVVAVVAALLYLGDSQEKPDATKVHNLAQIAHSRAQGKIGSGFDVATAVFGTIMYSRFDPKCIPSDLSHDAVVTAVTRPWKMTAESCQVPKNFEILMGDVAHGSETPGMVKKVLEWKANHAEGAAKLFADLNSANLDLMGALTNGNADEIRAANKRQRAQLGLLTELTGVPIEPESQAQLLNRVTQVDGVLAGVVPGAGGFDAVCLVLDTSVRSRQEILSELQEVEGVAWLVDLEMEKDGLKVGW